MAKRSDFFRWVSLCFVAVAMAGCGSSAPFDQMPLEPGKNLVINSNHKPLQCVPYARDHSGIKIFGDAYTWWDKAEGKFPRGAKPAPGSVMVLTNYAGPQRGHVAVVKKIISSREIRIDHANWLEDGSIYINDPVMDVSADNNWSQVRVYNIKAGAWGTKIFPVQGFIGSGSDVPDGSDVPASGNGTVAEAPEPPVGGPWLPDELTPSPVENSLLARADIR